MTDWHLGFVVFLVIWSTCCRREVKPLLKNSCELKLQMERNLDRGFSHNVPDLSIKGGADVREGIANSQQAVFIMHCLFITGKRCGSGFLCTFFCFICRPSDSNVSEDAGLEPRTVAT
jgi:hypothetical protein